MIAELTKMLQSAAKGKAPVVAIPIEGHAPVCLDRKRLAAWIKGVTVTSVVLDYGGSYSVRNVKIFGHAGRVKTTCTMFVIQRAAATLAIGKWADAERAKNLKIIGQGAISTVALKEAKKAAKAKERAAKLLQMEKGGCAELKEAQREEWHILAAARNHGRGPEKETPPHWKRPEDIELEKAEQTLRSVAHHNTPHRVRKTAAVIYWRLKALHTAWHDITKYNHRRRKTTKNKFLKAKKAIQVIQIVKDYTALLAKLQSVRPARLPHPRWPEEQAFCIDPLSRPGAHKNRNHYEYVDHYDREALAKRLRIARETIRILTPPPDEMDMAA